MDRRGFLQLGAGALLSAPTLLLADSAPANAWPSRAISVLPASPIRRVAWTIDDGFSVSALRAYVDLLQANPELRQTFFVTSGSSAWVKVAPDLVPLIKEGRVQIGNHTASHPNLQHLPVNKIQAELSRCHHFIQDHFGVDERPIFRPPYGDIDDRVAKAAADIGFSTPVLWYGTFASGAGVPSGTVAYNAKKWLHNGRIVIDHANGMATPGAFKAIMRMLAERNLQTVTIKDAYPHL